MKSQLNLLKFLRTALSYKIQCVMYGSVDFAKAHTVNLKQFSMLYKGKCFFILFSLSEMRIGLKNRFLSAVN